MAKVVGFNQQVADAARVAKTQDQRVSSDKRASKHIHMQRIETTLSNPVLQGDINHD